MAYDLEKLMELATGPVEPETPAPAVEQRIIQVSIGELEDFPSEKHRFRPATGERLKELEESIRINGILNALLIRILPDGRKQILAGHNRRTAAGHIGYKTVPCVVKDAANDDEALLIVIHDNINNRDLLPSERGWAYRDSIDIRNRQGKRTDLTFSQNREKVNSYQDLAKEVRHSKNNIHRYIRLTYLLEPLLTLVDQGKIGLGTGEQLSYLSRHSQEIVYEFCYATEPGHPLKETHAKALRAAEEDPDRIVDDDLLEELTAKKQTLRFRTLKLEMSALRDYFPAGTPEEVVRQTIQTALAIYFEKKEDC